MIFTKLIHLYKKQPLSSRMTWSISILSIILLILIAISAYRIALEESQEVIDKQMEEMADFLASVNIAHRLSNFDPHRRYGERDVFIDIVDLDQLPTLIKNHNYLVDHLDHPQFIRKNSSRGKIVAYVLPLTDRQIQISQLVFVRKNLARELAFNMLIPYFIFMPFTILAVYFLIRYHLRPLADLKTIFSQRDYNDLSEVQVKDLPVEITPAIDELNYLFKRIEAAQQQQQKFIANAAHELRTPLTALSLQTAVLIKTPKDSPFYQENIDDLDQNLKRMSHLVHQLMSLAHQEALSHEALIHVNLLEIIRQCTGQLLANARKKDIDVQVNIDDFNEKLEVQATISALESIFLNLIDNAIKYSPEHGQILIKLCEQPDRILVEIHDSGRGIAPEQYEHVMQRFVRLIETQSQSIGSGLGFSIVQSALESIQATIQLDRSEILHGLKIKLYFKL
ncbi:two-component sensor histidine kinase [Acinetobacter guerrae]|uniref:histidine kinase n=1 Tax=Acinetobacter guerrae TaxID=1843371 RepID=A0A3A8EG20_9GAMM|nr:ATP-binding protein [Acinetobacter guerrae]RKG33872.1 two-component sensor histidine kinase [Acinetobacter guerrae]